MGTVNVRRHVDNLENRLDHIKNKCLSLNSEKKRNFILNEAKIAGFSALPCAGIGGLVGGPIGAAIGAAGCGIGSAAYSLYKSF